MENYSVLANIINSSYGSRRQIPMPAVKDCLFSKGGFIPKYTNLIVVCFFRNITFCLFPLQGLRLQRVFE
jgi:hypothetical protein